MIKRIELDKFNNRLALEMGLSILELARDRSQTIAINVSRLNHCVFQFIDDTLPADKHEWLRRKANVAKHFEESSLSVKKDLIKGKMTLEKTFGLDDANFVARGGSIPIFVRGIGMIATITISGLRDEEDHQLIIDALKGTYF